MKFLKNKQSQLVRILVRAEKTHKVVINHLLQAKCPGNLLICYQLSWAWLLLIEGIAESPSIGSFSANITRARGTQPVSLSDY